MFNNVALDVFIGLVFIFLLYSLLATILQEMIATRFAFRAKVLEKAILRMLEDGKTTSRVRYGDRINGILHVFGLKNLLKEKQVAPWFYAHPLIKYLGEDNYYSKPAYLDASNFSKVMLDLLKGFGQPESQTIQAIHNSIISGTIYKLPINISSRETDKANPAIKILRAENPDLPAPDTLALQTVPLNPNTALFLRSLWQDSGADINTFRLKLEQWFDDTMERATGWYKRYTRIVLFTIGLVVAYVFNVDTIAIHRILSTNKTAREQMVQMAINNKDNLNPNNFKSDISDKHSDSLLNATYKMVLNDASLSNDILGLDKSWKDSCTTCNNIFNGHENRDSFYKKYNSLTIEKSISDSLKMVLQSNKKMRAFKDSLLKNPALPAIDVKQINAAIKSLDDTNAALNGILRIHDSNWSTRLNVMNILIARCPSIQNRKLFQFSPNQAGGLETITGWLITALAITLGAPFWFDLLSKLISLRGAGNKITPSDDEQNKKQGNGTASLNPVTVTVNTNSGEEAVG